MSWKLRIAGAIVLVLLVVHLALMGVGGFTAPYRLWWYPWWRWSWQNGVQGNAAEQMLASVVIVAVGSVLYPPLRHWLERKWGGLHARLDAIEQSHAENKALLHHMIGHLDEVPNEVPGPWDNVEPPK